MKRRSFIKKSIAAAIIAATPMALTGLVNAEGSGEGSGTDTGYFFTSTTSVEYTNSSETQCAVSVNSNGLTVNHNSYLSKCEEKDHDGKKRWECRVQCSGSAQNAYCSDNHYDGGDATDTRILGTHKVFCI